MVDVSIITISTNELNYLKKMIPSLKKYETKVNYELIIIDNASIDGTSEWLKKNYPDIKIIKNRKKQGVTFNNNIGMKRSTGKFILIANPDIVYIGPLFKELMDYLNENPDIGIIAPKLLNDDRTIQDSVRRFYSYATLFVRKFPFFRKTLLKSKTNKLHLYYDKNRNKIFYTDWAISAFIMFKRDLLKKIGFIDERFIIYFDDVDFCRRCWQAGYKIVYYPFKSIIHLYKRESDTVK